MTEKLKPCPFCGRVNMQQVKSSGRWGFFVRCRCCAVGPSAHTRRDAIAAWNTRSQPEQEQLSLEGYDE